MKVIALIVSGGEGKDLIKNYQNNFSELIKSILEHV